MAWSGGVFTRTNGTYSGSGVWASDAAAAVKIQSSRHDTHDQDLAQGINACVAKDGSNTMTILNLSGTVNSTSGIIKVGSVVLASTYGTNNAFFGGAGNFTLSGTGNTAVGSSSFTNATTATTCVAVGGSSLAAATTCASATAVGYFALNSVTGGNENTALGSYALQNVAGVLAVGNIAIGASASKNQTAGGSNITIGYNIDLPSLTGSNQLNIQNAIYGTGNHASGSSVSTGNLGCYVQAPTARWHLPAGTATAGTAPLKLTAGTNLGTPENGAIEFDGNAVYITIGGVRKTFTVT